MEHICHVCRQRIEPDAKGLIRLEGITAAGDPDLEWIWGPVEVHEECRLDLHTPLDNEPDVVMTWDRIPA